jgi:hypothetical protein
MPRSCYNRPSVARVQSARVRSGARRPATLAGGAHVLVVLLDYWSVWLGGSYATAEGEA